MLRNSSGRAAAARRTMDAPNELPTTCAGTCRSSSRSATIGDIVANAALSSGALAATVTAPVVGENAERARERRHHRRPVLMVAPRAVHQHERIAGISSDLPVDADAIDSTGRHDGSRSLYPDRNWPAAATHPAMPMYALPSPDSARRLSTRARSSRNRRRYAVSTARSASRPRIPHGAVNSNSSRMRVPPFVRSK